ncbi:hypothetical protein [Alistipes indistinctus]|uniref:hypothetical protein n=1 Tax=Alistipes indistinctus TaxID=626932 RepID=UPI0015F1D228|nr:hypothetical protein [Alistipes indistinctus]BCG53653.1 hypothetical protein AI2BBH_06990 [Alistipes indistinctus]
MIDEHNYEQWAMDYIEGTLGAEQRRAFDAFLAGHPAIAAQIGPLQSDLPVLPPETVVYPDKTGLLRGRTISLARRQDRLQRFGAMASGAAAAAVLFGGLLFFHPGEGTKGPERIAAEAAEAYPEGAEALAARFDRQEATDTGHDATTAGTGNAGTRNSIAAAVPATDATHASAALAAHYGNTGDRTAASGQGTPAGPARTGNSSSAPSFIKRTDAAPASGTAAETGIFENSLPTESVLGSLSQPAELYLPEPALTAVPVATLPVRTPEPQSLIAHRIETTRTATARNASQDDGSIRSSLGSLLSTLNDLSPVSRYNTTEESGVTIASFIHISKRKSSN